MEREIIFRGFNRKNGVWLHGFYLQNRGHHFVCPDEFADGKSWEDYEIDPSTLGQYTGLNDKNGKSIYESDIVRYYDDIEDELVNGVVVYDADYCSFVVKKEKSEDSPLNAFWQFEVVGNRFDNPGLMKGGKE